MSSLWTSTYCCINNEVYYSNKNTVTKLISNISNKVCRGDFNLCYTNVFIYLKITPQRQTVQYQL